MRLVIPVVITKRRRAPCNSMTFCFRFSTAPESWLLTVHRCLLHSIHSYPPIAIAHVSHHAPPTHLNPALGTQVMRGDHTRHSHLTRHPIPVSKPPTTTLQSQRKVWMSHRQRLLETDQYHRWCLDLLNGRLLCKRRVLGTISLTVIIEVGSSLQCGNNRRDLVYVLSKRKMTRVRYILYTHHVVPS